MNEEELANALSQMTDDWERGATDRYDEIMQYIVVWLALQNYSYQADFSQVILDSYRRAGVDMNLQSRVDAIRETYPDAQLNTQALQSVRSTIDLQAVQAQARVRQVMAEAAASGATADEIRQAIEEELATQMSRMTQRMVDAQTMTDRTVLAGVGAPYYQYLGPSDAKNRPFCADIVNRRVVYTPRGVNALNAHPLLHSYVPPNVSVLCGGYNCRHLWMPVENPPKGWDVEGREDV